MSAANHQETATGFLPMGEGHLSFLGSDGWAQMLTSDLLPWLAQHGGLGEDVLELGPGPGRTTDLLRQGATRVTAVELDGKLAAALADRLADSNVEVVHGDGTRTGLPADRFSTVTCFHVLHHVPSLDLQDALFAEAYRVLRPGGRFLVADALDTPETRTRHHEEQETFLPVDTAELPARLGRVGFVEIEIERAVYQLRVRACKV